MHMNAARMSFSRAGGLFPEVQQTAAREGN
jgi:hypothetical protein